MKLPIVVLCALALMPAARGFAAPCKPEGTPLVTLDQRGMAQRPTSITELYPSGAWTIVAKDGAGKTTSSRAGCLDKAQLEKIAADVKVPWTVTQKRINCKLVATTWTVDSVNGKEVFTERACGRDLLDDKSAAALADIHAILDKL